MRLERVAYGVFVVCISFGLREASAGPCVVSGPPYKLTSDTIDWSMKVTGGQNCVRDFRLNKALSSSPVNVAIENVTLVSPPQSGQITMQGAGFSYTAKAHFHGEDSFTIAVSGTMNRTPGSSTIQIVVSVIDASSVLAAPGFRARLPASAPVPRAPTIPAANNAPPLRAGASQSSTSAQAVDSAWNALRIGAGGFVTGINIVSDGTKVARTDTYGAYVWDVGMSTWKQLLTTYSMPASDVGHDRAGGVYEIAIAPSQTSRFYMSFNGYVYRSDNRGAAWSRTAFTQAKADANNGSTRLFGRYMAVDPANPDIVYVGTPSNGLRMTFNGGASWTQVSGVATATSSGLTQGGGHLVAFDPASSVVNGKTQGIYATSYGTGLYHSTDGGASWTLTSGTPTTHRHLVVDQKGTVYLTDNSGGANNVNRWNGSAWSQFAIGGRGHSIAVDPANASRIFIGIDSGDLIISTNAGSTWAGPTFGRATRTATDVPWLAWTKEVYMANGDMAFDPSGSNLLYFAEGIGVWHSNPPNSNAAVQWVSQSAGIEQLVGTVVLAPPGGGPVVMAWDRPLFYVSSPDTYPATYGPNNINAIIAGWSADYASGTPTTLVAVMNWWGVDVSGISMDGGKTWKAFASVPAEVASGAKIGGSIAAASATNFIWVPSNNSNPWRTIDGGGNWTQISIPGVPTSGNTGWGFAYYLNRQIVAADRVLADTFYLYNGPLGLYKSTDKGATWTRVFSREIAAFSGFGASLKSVPGQTGHLFFTSGAQSGTHPANTQFMRSIDGGTTWTAVGNFKEVHAFGFGATYPGESYPAIFAAGYNGGVWGIWRSIDNAATWTLIGNFPLGSFDTIKTIDGDKSKAGTVYIGFGGSGFAYKTNYLLRRDLNGHGDNKPMWLSEAA